MTFRPSTAAVRLGSWLVASSIAAELSHAGIEAVGRVVAGGTYEGREHGTVAVVALAALVFGATTLLAAVLLKLRYATVPDPIRLSPLAVLFGSFGILLAMEFAEQIAACGHVEGVSDALGGNISSGLAVVSAAAVSVYRFGVMLASPIVRSAACAAGVIALWISACGRFVPSIRGGKIARVAFASPRSRGTALFLARSLGLRAPPIGPLSR